MKNFVKMCGGVHFKPKLSQLYCLSHLCKHKTETVEHENGPDVETADTSDDDDPSPIATSPEEVNKTFAFFSILYQIHSIR